MKYFFLTGAHKSGTSWLSQMIRRHPAVAMPRQELWMFGHPRGLAGAPFDKMVSDWLSLGTVAAQFPPQDHEDLKASLRRALVVTTLQRFAKPGCEAIGEKTPLFTLRGLSELKASFSGAYVISILRDGRDAVVSHHFHNLRLRDFSLYPDQAVGEAAYAYHVARTSEAAVPLLNEATLRRVASNWAECLRAETAVKEIIGKRGLCLRYEELLSNTPSLLTKIFDHLALKSDQALINKIVRATTFEKMSKGRKAGETDPQSFVRKGSTGDWKLYFDHESAATFNSCAGAELVAGDMQVICNGCPERAIRRPPGKHSRALLERSAQPSSRKRLNRAHHSSPSSVAVGPSGELHEPLTQDPLVLDASRSRSLNL